MSTPGGRLSRPESMHEQIARHVRNDIEAGVLRHGQALPSTREMAKEWDTSVFTVTEAMKLLEREGLVISKSRAGRVVNAPEQSARGDVRTHRPTVMLIGGYAGSGKTELGRILARETGWPMLDKDTLTRPVVEAALETLGRSPHDRESEVYLEVVRPREYEALLAATTENVQCGNSAIVTAPFIKEFKDLAWMNRTVATFEALEATVVVVWVYCDEATMHTYVRHRGAARDAVKLGNWAEYVAAIDTSFRPPVEHRVVDNSASSEPLQAQAKRLVESVAAQGAV
ncbi:GntR family transcriptional regulator [Lentzea sp. NPDC004789]